MLCVATDGERLGFDIVCYQASGPEEQIQNGLNKKEVHLDRRNKNDHIICTEQNTMLNHRHPRGQEQPTTLLLMVNFGAPNIFITL
jgi:hypothetical protein